jgi:hypothetical protein
MDNHYGMSETGHCPRVLSAIRLGEKPKETGELDLARLKHYSRLEAVAAEGLWDEGFEVLDAGECKICNNGRCGHHIEIEEGLFRLIGHIDRRVILPDKRQLPVEIKSLGPASWKEFEADQFKGSMSYAYQEASYLKHENSPGIYWVMNRDSGKTLKYIINDFNNEYNFPGFTKLTLPVTYEQIVDKLNSIELDVAEGKLCDPVPNEDCHWCHFTHLCTGNNKKFKIFVDDGEVKKAAIEYKSALEAEKLATSRKQSATGTLLGYAKMEGNEKFKTQGISFSYNGPKYKTTHDIDKLERILKDLNMIDSQGKKITCDTIINQIEKRGNMYDGYTIRVIETPEK